MAHPSGHAQLKLMRKKSTARSGAHTAGLGPYLSTAPAHRAGGSDRKVHRHLDSLPGLSDSQFHFSRVSLSKTARIRTEERHAHLFNKTDHGGEVYRYLVQQPIVPSASGSHARFRRGSIKHETVR